MKIGPLLSEIFEGYADFCRIVQKVSIYNVVISGVSAPKFTEFVYYVNRSSLLSICISISRYPNPFGNATVPNEGYVGDFAPKLVATATPYNVSGKEGQVDHLSLQSNIYRS